MLIEKSRTFEYNFVEWFLMNVGKGNVKNIKKDVML